MDWIISVDQDLFLFLNGIHSSWGDDLMWLISNKYSWIPIYVLILGALIKYHGVKKAVFIALSIVPLIILSDQISSGLLKPLIARPRPCHAEPLDGLVHIVNNKCGGPYGFVSSHAANFFALATFLSPFFNKYFRIVAFTSAALVGFSRIYLGVHYPGDVIVGAVLGIAIGFLVLWVFNKLVSSGGELSTNERG